MLSKPLSEFVSAGYGELFFVAEEEPVLTTEWAKKRDKAMKEYENWEAIDIDDFYTTA